MRLRGITTVILLLALIATGASQGQTATGAIVGRASDATRAAIPGVTLEISNEQTALKRTLLTGADGDYYAPALLAGSYQIIATAKGFQRLVREVVVEAGTATTADLLMQVGSSTESITVSGANPQMHYDTFEISGVTTRPVIDGLPVNGRDFLELAKLEPGAQQATRGSNNRVFVPLLATPAGGNNGRGTLVTVDGGSIMQIGNGGTAMGYSQEVVQEFQVTTANFDLSTGMTASGSVNIATRSGGNAWHGSGFYFFRNHDLSAYPALKRDPFNPNPFFQRQQYGAAVGGPILKNRLFVFGTIERNDQRGVVSTELLTPEFAPLSRITPSPTYVDQLSVRLDWLIDKNNTAFIRQSHEGGFSFAPTTVNGLNQLAYPSAWTRQPEWADQSIFGWTLLLDAHWVNDLRFSYFFVSSDEQAPEGSDCPGCLGIGAPAINVPDLYIGTSTTTAVLGRRFDLNDIVAWQAGQHYVRFGGDWEITRGGRTDTGDQPVSMDLFAPKDVRNYNVFLPPSQRIPLPPTFLTLPDILDLPVKDFSVGIGDPYVPQRGFGRTRISPLAHLFIQDKWHLSPSFTLSYGLGWSFDAPLNYDLAKPAYLATLLTSAQLHPTRLDWSDFSPSAGFAWSPGGPGRTVVRGGAGIYYDFQTSFGIADNERVSLGPKGVGRGTYVGAGISNPLSDVPGVPQGAFLNFPNPTNFTGASLLEALSTIRANLAQQRGDPNNRDLSATNIETDKQGSLTDSDLPHASSTQFGVGIQREIAQDFVISADFVFRHFDHITSSAPGLIDVDHFFAARGPQLPLCTANEQDDPKTLCSLGPISMTTAMGSGRYLGLLIRGEKLYSHGWQILGSYAYSSSEGLVFSNGTGFNNDDPLTNYGPLNTDFRNILSISGLGSLPGQIQLGYFVTYVSRPPFSVILGTLDLNGDGNNGDLLPGTKVNQFNRGLGKRDLAKLVDVFDKTYSGKKDANGVAIPLITLPQQYEFGDLLLTDDLRLSRNLHVRDRVQMMLIGEVFNLCNFANLSGRSNNVLVTSGFGQPKSRVNQVFGSGGPRAFQLGARISF
jgi:Carboxypeptidase regulatory-like domain